MENSDLTFAVAAAGGISLAACALYLRARLQVGEDFVLGRRRLAGHLAAIGIAMQGVPFWCLLLLTGTAYLSGKSAVWLALALVGGVAVCGFSIAPRLRARSQLQEFSTVSQILAGDAGERSFAIVMRSAAAIAAITLILLLTLQMQWIASHLSALLGLPQLTTLLLLGGMLCLCVLLGGFWLTVWSDALQLAAFLSIAIVSLIALLTSNHAIERSDFFSGGWFDENQGLLSISFLVGVGFVLGQALGQSALLSRFMACKSDAELGVARRRALLWTMITSALALAMGWLARSLSRTPQTLDQLVATLGPPDSNRVAFIATLTMVATAWSLCSPSLAVASHVGGDLRRGGAAISLARCRIALVVSVLIALALAAYLPKQRTENNFAGMLFCWHAMGAAFGPLVIVRLTGKRVRTGSTLGAMWAGFLLTIVFFLMPDTPGDLLERSLPFTAALGIALTGGERRRNPDRADRGERTLHDRLPI